MHTLMMALSALIILAGSSACAQETGPKGFNTSGFIANAVGDQCWYNQIYEKTNLHFLPESMAKTTGQDVRTIHFEDADCIANELEDMPAAEIVNKYMINRTISNWFLDSYVLEDANFDTRNVRPHGRDEARGECIQSLDENGGDGIVTLLNGRAANCHRTQTQAAAVTVCHRPIAWLRNWRNVFRDIRWRWTLKVL